MKTRSLVLPVKGHYYYSALHAYNIGLLQPETPIKLIPEPDNQQDRRAVQIWLTHFPCWLLGYVPRRKARFIGYLLEHDLIQNPTLHNTRYRNQRLKLQLRLDYALPWKLRLDYWLRLLGF
ncbi:HIRAN domain-containing protein [Hydrogenovibrio marinus]|uniref:HIRAN domain-containing protein n=1 Tax=Hydrogenovibrio marinus TaxID=28885 RepID=UPI0009E05733|nr:HIRAN domain-containing protein [Hydrogenovibrio marinus]